MSLAQKSDRTIKLLGCSFSELVSYLERQFKEGMSWDNYGRQGWHMDHIVPCAAFDLTDPDQQKKCFHYTNLQPLWAKDNLEKGPRMAGIDFRKYRPPENRALNALTRT